MHRSSRRAFLRTASTTASAAAIGVATAGAASAVTGLGLDALSLDGLATDRSAGALTDQLLKLARVWVDRDNAHLLGEFDDTHNVFDDGSVEILLWPGDAARLAQTGLPFQITVDDLVARDAALQADAPARPTSLRLQPGETEDGAYRTLAQHNADMQMLATENPDICELLELPFLSLQGRTVYGLEIAEEVARKDGRPVYYNDGVHHAREWPAAEMPIMWAFDLIDSYRRATGEPDRAYGSAEADPQDLRMLNLVRKTRNIIVPVVNPDGFDYSRTGPAGTGRDVADSSLTGVNPVAGMQYWRKNMRGVRVGGQAFNPGVEAGIPQNGVLPTTPGAVGVDCNRNYSYRWGGDGSSASETGQTYRGVEPFSEPEAQNVQYLHQIHQCVSGITHHTSGNLVLWAWGDTHDDAPDDVLLARLGFACADHNGYRPTKSIDLYVTTGTCSDYTYGTFGSISYTFEHAGSSFHPEYSSVVPVFYANNREALMLMAELVCLEPEDRDLMHAAVAASPDLQLHLTGDFVEEISNTEYAYVGNPLDLTGRHNCVISGRLVDAEGNGVKGTVRNVKTFDNPLTPGNPIDEATWPELWSSEIQTDGDGRFRWVVYPTTRPALEFEGEEETITLQFDGAAGTAERAGIHLSRGDVLDLEEIVLS